MVPIALAIGAVLPIPFYLAVRYLVCHISREELLILLFSSTVSGQKLASTTSIPR